MTTTCSKLRAIRIPSNLHARSSVWVISFVLLALSPLAADTVDARQQLEASLQSKGMVQKRRTVMKPVRELHGDCGERRCRDWYEIHNRPFIETYADYLHVTSANVVKVIKIVYDKPVLNLVPVKLHVRTVTGKNCTQSKQTINTTLALSVQTSQSVTWSRTVMTGTSFTLGLSFNQSFSYGGGTVGQTESGSVTFSRSVSVTDGTQQNWTENVNASEQVVRDVPPMTQVWGSLQVAESDMGAPFTASVVVDGPVDANDNNIAQVSEILSEDQRTFLVQGMIHATSASGDIVTFYAKELTPVDCANSKGTFGTGSVDGSAAVLPLLLPTKEAVARSALALPPDADIMGTNVVDIGDLLKKSDDIHMSSLDKVVGGGSVAADASSDDQTIRGAFNAEGLHVCKSENNLGYSCPVSGVGYRDCNEALASLKADDCCQRSKVCGPDVQSGEIKCEFGGLSTGFTLNSCSL